MQIIIVIIFIGQYFRKALVISPYGYIIILICIFKLIIVLSIFLADRLSKIYILKEFAGKGVGNKSLKFVESIAKKRSKKAIFLESMQKGPALPFYLKNDFDIVAESTVPFKNVIEEEKPMFLLKKMI